MRIGFIGFGEAAYCICAGLHTQGVEDIIAFDAMANDRTMGKLVQERARETGVKLYDTATDVAKNADILFGAVPSSYTLDVCNAVVEHLHSGQIYADVSASTPKLKQEIWDLVKDTGVLFVDAAMLGSLPQDKHRVPITASGNGATEFRDQMAPYGMRITCVDGGPGAASAIKLVRSIFMKGTGALMVEMLQAADAYQVTDDVVSSIAKSMDGIPFTQHLDRLVIGTAIHATRRAAELKGSIQMSRESDLDETMTTAAKHKHDLLSELRFQERYIDAKPAGYGEIISVMNECKGAQ